MTDHAQTMLELADRIEAIHPILLIGGAECPTIEITPETTAMIIAALRSPAIGTPDGWSCGTCGDRDVKEKFRVFGSCYKCAAQRSIDKRNRKIGRLEARLAAIGTPDNAREAVARIIDPHSFLPDTSGDEMVGEIVRQSKEDAFRKTDRILAALAAIPRERESKPVAVRDRMEDTLRGGPRGPLDLAPAIPPSDSPGSAHSLKLAEQALARQHVPTEAEIERLADDLVAAGETDTHQPQGGDAREALEYYAAQYCEGWCNQDNSQAKFNDCGGCRARQALAKSPVMQSAEKAAKVIDTWSNSKREYASRIVATTPAAPVREADPTQKQRVAMMRARSAAPVLAAQDCPQCQGDGYINTHANLPDVVCPTCGNSPPTALCAPLLAAAEPGEMIDRLIRDNPYTSYSFAAQNDAVERHRAGKYARMIACLAVEAALSPASANEGKDSK